jgi:hypothetical protein
VVVRALVQVCQAYGIHTVAEFVQDDGTLRLLREFGVDYAQGYAIEDLTPVAQRVVPLGPQPEAQPRPVSDRARLLRGRLLDHREAQRISRVPGLGVVGRGRAARPGPHAAERNASVRVLEKSAFVRDGDNLDGDVGLVWRFRVDRHDVPGLVTSSPRAIG